MWDMFHIEDEISCNINIGMHSTKENIYSQKMTQKYVVYFKQIYQGFNSFSIGHWLLLICITVLEDQVKLGME